MAPDQAEQIATIMRTAVHGPLAAEHFAAATGADLETARGWLAARQVPQGSQLAHAHQLCMIVDRLAAVIERDYIPVWLATSIPRLGDRPPLQAIRNGDSLDVSRLIATLEGTPIA